MNKLFSTLTILLFILTITNGQPSEQNSRLFEAKEAIRKSNKLYGEAFVKNDPQLFYDRYAEDACIMPANITMLCGWKHLVCFTDWHMKS